MTAFQNPRKTEGYSTQDGYFTEEQVSFRTPGKPRAIVLQYIHSSWRMAFQNPRKTEGYSTVRDSRKEIDDVSEPPENRGL